VPGRAEHCCSQLLPAGLQAFWERPCQSSVQMFPQVWQAESRGELKPRRLTALHHRTVTPLSHCWAAKTNWGQKGWLPGCVKFSGDIQPRMVLGSQVTEGILCTEITLISKKTPASDKYFPNSSCLPKINPRGLTHTIPPFDISG